MKNKFKLINIQYVLFFLYLLSIFVYRSQTQSEVLFFKITFVSLVLFTLIINKFKVKVTPHFFWQVIFIAFYMLSFIWAKDANDTSSLLLNFVYIICITIVLNDLTKSEKSVEIILKIFVLSMLYMAVVLIIRTPFSSWGTERIGDIIGENSNHIGIRLSVSIVILFYFFSQILKNKKTKNRKVKIIGILGITLALFILILLTGSKMAIITVVFSVVFFELVKSKGIKLVGKMLSILLILCVIVYQIFNNPFIYNVLGRRLEATINTVTGSNSIRQDNSFIERKFFRTEGIKLFLENPLIGYGGNNFKTHMREIRYTHVTYSHNNYIELLANLGLTGFITYYSFIIWLIINLFKNYLKNKEEILLLMISILLCLLISDYGRVSYYGLFDSMIITIIYLTYFIKKGRELK